jgi:sugar diacid utilization regulator
MAARGVGRRRALQSRPQPWDDLEGQVVRSGGTSIPEARDTARTGWNVDNQAQRSRRAPHRAVRSESDEDWLAKVAAAASHDAGEVPAELLGDYLTMLADAAIRGRRPHPSELEAVGGLGRRAAELEVSAGRVVSLYLSAARRLWELLPMEVRDRDRNAVRTAADAVLHVIDGAVAALAEGYADARRQMVRREETMRREVIDDLLRGDAHLGQLAERAEPFGLDLGRPHQVALAAPHKRLPDIEPATSALERRVLDWFGDRDVLVAAKDGLLVVLAPAEATGSRSTPRRRKLIKDVGDVMHAELNRLPQGRPWSVAVGRRYPGAYGIARSYEEARDALAMAARLPVNTPVIRTEDLLIYRVLVRDQPAIVDLVQTVLGPLVAARGGAEPLLETLDAYFATGEVATETAKRLHLSVRAVTYRLARVRALTGYAPTDPAHRFTVHAAVLGAKLLGWPANDISTPG